MFLQLLLSSLTMVQISTNTLMTLNSLSLSLNPQRLLISIYSNLLSLTYLSGSPSTALP
jgi:hypothetical protein